jgi:lipoprotein-anchoring transpeptidase ErfK/SrfK
MIIMKRTSLAPRRRAIGGLIAAALLLTLPQAAQAQGFFDWIGAGGTNSASDRQTVSFSPAYAPGEIIVSFGDRRLYHVTGRGRAVSYPIAVPRAESRWSGTLRVSQKRVNPPWTPTPEMRRENPNLPMSVPGGHPRNPLGVRALYLGNTLYRIHGTDAPYTIGQNVSKGCVRMHNEHVLELYNRVPVGTKVTATWQRFGAGQPVAQRQKSGGSSEWRPW